MVLEGLDGSFGRVHSMIVWFNELPLAIFLFEEFLEGLGRLIVSDVQQRLVSLGYQCFVYVLKRLDDRVVRDIGDWLREDVIRVIIICHEIVLIRIL